MADENRLTRNTSPDATGDKLLKKIKNCEPPDEQPDPFLWFFYKVVNVEERFEKKHVSGFGDDAVFDTISQGWFITFQQQLTFFAGPHEPKVSPGDEVKIALSLVKKASQ